MKSHWKCGTNESIEVEAGEMVWRVLVLGKVKKNSGASGVKSDSHYRTLEV